MKTRPSNKLKIAIASGKGGVGKSMISSSLSLLFSKERKVIAVDCDVDAPNLAIWLGENFGWKEKIKLFTEERPVIDYRRCQNCEDCLKVCRFGAMKIVNGKLKIDYFLCEGCGACQFACKKGAFRMKPVNNGEIRIKKTKYGFYLVSGFLYPGYKGSGGVVDEIKNKADDFEYDIMIVDAAAGRGCPVISALKDIDVAILVTEPTVSGFTDLKKIHNIVSHFRIPYFVIINKWDINKNISLKIEKWAGKRILGKISYDKQVFDAVSRMKPIMETDLQVRFELAKIYKKLISEIYASTSETKKNIF